MKLFLKKLNLKAVVIISLFSLSLGYSYGQTLINNIVTPITTNFTNLTNGSWVNNTYTNAQGWYAYFNGPPTITPNAILLSSGSSTSVGRVYTFGVDASQRSFGLVPNGTTGSKSYLGWRLKNNTGATINSLRIDWKGKQWYRNESGGNQTIVLQYSKAVSFNLLHSGTYTTLSPVFNTPQSEGASGTLNGNLPENYNEVTNNISGLSLAAGQEIMLRWVFTSNGSNYHAFGIDDVTISYLSSQTVTFAEIEDKTFGDSPKTLSATASSGLAVTYTSSNTNVATISGSTLTFTGPGTATITARQAGNAEYSSATSTQVVNVSPQSPNLSATTNITSSSFQANWTANNGANDAEVDYYITYATDPGFSTEYYAYTSNKSKVINADVVANKVYYYKVNAYTGSLVSESSEVQKVVIGNNFTSGTWPSGILAANRVVISTPSAVFPNNPSNTVSINELEVTNAGRIENTQSLYIAKNLILSSASNGVAGQILNRGNVTFANGAKIIIRKTFVANQWHFMGFPFNVPQANIFIAGTNTPATWGNRDQLSNNIVVQRYNGENRSATGSANYSQGLNWVNVSPKTFVANQGYIVWATSNITLDFVIDASDRANFFNTSASVGVAIYNSNPLYDHRSWNLLSTPFASAYELKNSAFHAPFQVYNAGTQTYDAIMGTDSYEINPYNAYFFQAKGVNFSFVNTGRRLNAPATNASQEYDDLHLALSNENYRDLTRIRYHAEASKDLDIDKDAPKILSFNANVPQIFSVIGNRSFAVNTSNLSQKEFEVHVLIPAKGKYKLALEARSLMPNIVSVMLVDKTTGATIDLTKNNVYEFDAVDAGTFNRFKVIAATEATDVTTATENAENEKLSVIASNNKARIVGNIKLRSVRVFDMAGKMIFAAKNFNSLDEIALPYKGIYLFDIETNSGNKQIKLLNK